MTPRIVILALGLLSLISPLAAQESGPDWFRIMHVRCEEAYMYNDYIAMKHSLDDRQQAIMDGAMVGMSKADSALVLGMLHKDWGSYHSCLAYIDGGGYSKAKECYEKSIDAFRDDALSSSVVRTELAQVHYRCREYAQALALLEDNYRFYSRQFIEETLITLSQAALCKARMEMFDEAVEDIDRALSLCMSAKGGISDRDILLQELRRKKGKILMLRAEACGYGAGEALGYFRDYFDSAKSSVVKTFHSMDAGERERYWLRMHPFVADCYRLEDEDPSLLYDVTLFSKSLLLQFSLEDGAYVTVDYRDVQKRLRKGECAMEFVRYESGKQICYGAVVLKSSGTPEFVRIAAEDELLGYNLHDRMTVGDALDVRARTECVDALYNCESFRTLVWNEDLRKKLENVSKVYFAPDGIFHLMAVEYMYPDRQDLSFYRLTSTRELLRDPVTLKDDRMLLCGGVNYFKAREETAAEGNDSLAYHLLKKRRPRFDMLKGSLAEVDSIYRLRNVAEDSLILGQEVTESVCGRLMGQYPVVMLSTHGYFAGGADGYAEDLEPRTSDNILSESVLILAGGQRNLQDARFDASQKDGILSARELSCMDLSSVDLMVVAACQSGLGRVTPDGVYGIQRGLKNAGVRAMIVSLWNVGDDATRHFMVRFNEALRDGADLQTSFEHARASMDEEVTYKTREYDARRDCGRTVIRKGRLYSDPYYKNAFVLIDNL